MPADFDTWLTTDPDDRDVCEEHPDEDRPCRLCRQQARIELWEALTDADR